MPVTVGTGGGVVVKLGIGVETSSRRSSAVNGIDAVLNGGGGGAVVKICAVEGGLGGTVVELIILFCYLSYPCSLG